MKENNVIQEKSYAFAIRIVKLSKYLIEDKKEYLFSKQIGRSGTSMGSNVEEAIGGQSEKDFFSNSFLQGSARDTLLVAASSGYRLYQS